MNNLENCGLECIVEPRELLFSGAMAPLDFKPASVPSSELRSVSLLDYASGILKEYGIFSSSIKPELADSGMIDIACRAATAWSGEFSAPSPSIAPKPEGDYTAKRWDKIVEELNLNAPSHTLQPLNKSDFSHDWSSQNNVLSGFNSPSSSFGALGKQNGLWKTPDFEMPEIPEFKPEILKFPEFKIPELPQFEISASNFKVLEKEPLDIFLLSKGEQIHLHQDRSSGSIKIKNKALYELDSYQSAMADHYLNNLGLEKKRIFCNPKKNIFERFNS